MVKIVEERPYLISIILICTGILSIIIGAILISKSKYPNTQEKILDYTHDCFSGPFPITEYLVKINLTSTYCRLNFTLDHNMVGPVDMYYQMVSFDQEPFAKSRDNEQLAGNLSSKPSENCGSFRFAKNKDGVEKPIAPCGQLADVMLTDIYDITPSGKEDFITAKSGILSEQEKIGYHNPRGNITLSEALTNYSKPLSWSDFFWENFQNNPEVPESVGFENDLFVGWMHTDWKLKPYARLGATLKDGREGLSAGAYTLRVFYSHYDRYKEQRLFILRGAWENNGALYGVGIAIVIFGIVVMLPAAVIMWGKFR